MNTVSSPSGEILHGDIFLSHLKLVSALAAEIGDMRAESFARVREELSGATYLPEDAVSIAALYVLHNNDAYVGLLSRRTALQGELEANYSGYRLRVTPVTKAESIMTYAITNPHMGFERDKEMDGRTPWNAIGRPVVGKVTGILSDGSFRLDRRGPKVLKYMDYIRPVKVQPFDREGSSTVSVSFL